MATVVISSETPLVDKTSEQTIVGAKTFQAASATAVPITVKDEAGIVKAGIAPTGKIFTRFGIVASTNEDNLGGYLTANLFNFPDSKGLVVRAAASQSANLTEWQNSAGTVQSAITNIGKLLAYQGAYIGGPAGSTALRAWRSAGSNSNIQSWEDENGNVLAAMSWKGELTSSSLYASGSTDNAGDRVMFMQSKASDATYYNGFGGLYVLNGSLKYRGSSGTITTLANA